MARRITLMAGILVMALAAGAAALWLGHRGRLGAAPTSVPVATAEVVRIDLASTTQLSGTLGYAGSYTVSAQGRGGTLTAMPQPGQVIRRGEPAYEVDGTPVYLFYGTRPEWRALARGVTPGTDVRQLEQNLTALGYADSQNLTVDDTFTFATYLAVRRWQAATEQTVTGQVALGTIAYVPGPLRVVGVPAALGSAAQAGEPVLSATSTTPVVTVSVPPAQTYLVHAHDPVTVTLPAGNTTPGRVQSISSVASDSQDAQPDSPSQAPPAAAQPSVAALVTLTHPGDAMHLDQAPVTVNVTDRAVKGVLAVPITALVALAGSGYGVYVDEGGVRRLVGVTPGLFATTLVQVTSASLHAGDRVEVPAQ